MHTLKQAAVSDEQLTQTDYASLAAFRYALRRFMHFSAQAAQDAGLTPTQHQALLSVKGHTGGNAISVGQLADHLVIAPHTAAELVTRLDEAGLVEKRPNSKDRRRLGLHLTRKAERALRRLSDVHVQEIREIAPDLIGTLQTLVAGPRGVPKSGVSGRGFDAYG